MDKNKMSFEFEPHTIMLQVKENSMNISHLGEAMVDMKDICKELKQGNQEVRDAILHSGTKSKTIWWMVSGSFISGIAVVGIILKFLPKA